MCAKMAVERPHVMRRCGVTVRGFMAAAVVASFGLPFVAWAAPPSLSGVSENYANIPELQLRLAGGKLDSQRLVHDFIRRIEALDQAGPRVNAVLQLNPDALSIAKQRDERKSGKHEGLWGIPVLLKANIDTGDRMPTTAGSLALLGAPAPRD